MASTLAVLALIAEFFIFKSLVAGRLSGAGAAAAHGLISAALALWAWRSAKATGDARLPLLLAVSTFAMGPVGPLGALAVIVLTRWYARSAVPFEEWYDSLFPELKSETLSHLFERAAAANHAELDPKELTPFADVLAMGSLEQKQTVIAVMGRHFQPAFGPLLRRALYDASNPIRVQAASVLNRLEDEFLERYIELSMAAKGDEPEALRDLAAHLGRHSRDGLFDLSRERESRDEAIATYRRYLLLRPDDVEAQLAMGRLLLGGGEYAEAAQLLDGAIGAGLATPKARLWHMECLFRLNRFAELRARAGSFEQDVPDAGELPAAAREAIRLWASEARS